jgi:hypothetical protein
MMTARFLLFLLFPVLLAAAEVTQPVLSVHGDSATIHASTLSVGISGFIVKNVDNTHSAILKSATVTKIDPKTGIATLKLSPYTQTYQKHMPTLKYKVAPGDQAVLGFGYDRAMLIAPSDAVYSRVTKSLPSLEWVHPDLLATILSQNGHPTPQRSDFKQMCDTASVGILYIYLDQHLFTLDCQSFKLLQITPAPMARGLLHLPFYNRIGKINSSWLDWFNWFGSGSNRLKVYAPYYLRLIAKNNPDNKEFFNFIKNNEQYITAPVHEVHKKDSK